MSLLDALSNNGTAADLPHSAAFVGSCVCGSPLTPGVRFFA